MFGKWQQNASLPVEGLGDDHAIVFWAAPRVRPRIAPASKLRIQIIDVAERARGEKSIAKKADQPLDAPFFVAARNG
jgi:hypothetical protein